MSVYKPISIGLVGNPDRVVDCAHDDCFYCLQTDFDRVSWKHRTSYLLNIVRYVLPIGFDRVSWKHALPCVISDHWDVLPIGFDRASWKRRNAAHSDVP